MVASMGFGQVVAMVFAKVDSKAALTVNEMAVSTVALTVFLKVELSVK